MMLTMFGGSPKREILCRAITLPGLLSPPGDNGKWITGYLVVERTRSDDIDTVTCIYPQEDPWHKRVVKPWTVGQYIGVEDANGQKIFEGDVLLFRNPSRHGEPPMMFVVEWYDEMCEFRLRNRDGKTLAIEKDLSNCYTVIDNIHDNPEQFA